MKVWLTLPSVMDLYVAGVDRLQIHLVEPKFTMWNHSYKLGRKSVVRYGWEWQSGWKVSGKFIRKNDRAFVDVLISSLYKILDCDTKLTYVEQLSFLNSLTRWLSLEVELKPIITQTCLELDVPYTLWIKMISHIQEVHPLSYNVDVPF